MVVLQKQHEARWWLKKCRGSLLFCGRMLATISSLTVSMSSVRQPCTPRSGWQPYHVGSKNHRWTETKFPECAIKGLHSRTSNNYVVTSKQCIVLSLAVPTSKKLDRTFENPSLGNLLDVRGYKPCKQHACGEALLRAGLPTIAHERVEITSLCPAPSFQSWPHKIYSDHATRCGVMFACLLPVR